MQVKSVIDALILVECHQIAIKVISDEESLHGLLIVADVPDLDRQVVSREDVGVARGGKLGPCHRVDDLAEEVLVLVGGPDDPVTDVGLGPRARTRDRSWSPPGRARPSGSRR